jgi:hypothetical protein
VRQTETGWRGVDDGGVVYDVTVEPGSECPDDRIVKVVDGKAVGVLMVEWKRGRRTPRSLAAAV